MSVFLRKYGVAATIDGIPLITRGAVDFKSTPTLAAGDVKISKDGGAFANLDALPTVAPASGTSVQVTLITTELQCARATIRFVDQTSPKEWEDQEVIVETYGHASAQFAVDLSDAVRFGLTALPAVAPAANGGLPTCDASNNVGITQAGADKAWSTAVRALTDKANFTLSSTYDLAKTAAQAGDAMALTSGERTTLAGVLWNALLSGMTVGGSIGKKLADWVLGTDNKVLLSSDAQSGVTIPTVTTLTNNVGITQAAADKVWTAADTGLFPTDTFGKRIVDNIDGPISDKASDADMLAVRAKTDEMTFTVPGQMDANVLSTAGQEMPSGVVVDDMDNTPVRFLTDQDGLDADAMRYALLVFISGGCVKQIRQVTVSDEDGFVTVHSPYTQTPADGDEFLLINR